MQVIVRENVKDFDTDHVFDCGQCFRWERERDGSYTGIASGRPPVNVAYYPYEDGSHSGRLVIDDVQTGETDGFWTNYLDLDTDYGKIKAELSQGDNVMAEAVKFGRGIRILKQEKWETLISFIISQNNNIGRIKGCIASLCENFGDHAGEYRGEKYFTFPGAEALASLTEKDLAVCRLGYRAKYIIKTAKTVKADGLEKLCGLEKADAKEVFGYLTGLCGVGPKVANCIMLFSMGKKESFPIDTWVREAMNRLYGMDKENVKAMAEYASEKFGGYGGIAQQYLFYYIRSL